MRLKPLEVDEIHNPALFAEFCRQRLGTSRSFGPKSETLAAGMKRIRGDHPAFTWELAAKIVLWAQGRGGRFRSPNSVLNCWEKAFNDGWLPELAPPDPDDEIARLIYEALQAENDDGWRYRLANSVGYQGKKATFDEWKRYRYQRQCDQSPTGS